MFYVYIDICIQYNAVQIDKTSLQPSTQRLYSLILRLTFTHRIKYVIVILIRNFQNTYRLVHRIQKTLEGSFILLMTKDLVKEFKEILA